MSYAFNGPELWQELRETTRFYPGGCPFCRCMADHCTRESRGLMSYGSGIVDGYRQVGLYVGRIL